VSAIVVGRTVGIRHAHATEAEGASRVLEQGRMKLQVPAMWISVSKERS